MKLLVTGGAGFIGSHLCERLIKDHEVICVDNFDDYYDSAVKERNVSSLANQSKFKLHRVDITDFEAIKTVFEEERPDKIIHLAARAGVRPSMENPTIYEKVNVLGTLNLLELSSEYKIKQFIFGSSSSVYGVRSAEAFSEDDDTNLPISVYGATKKSAELFCYTYANHYKIPTTILRFFTVYGPRQRPDLAIYRFSKLLFEGGVIPQFGDGDTMRDYTYVGDIVEGIVLALDNTFKYEIINLGNNKPTKLKELISLLGIVTGKKVKIKQLGMPPGDVPITYADISKAKKLLGWEPSLSIENGLKNFVEWFKKKV
jgi:UDP-glucuronate 4-epimerase